MNCTSSDSHLGSNVSYRHQIWVWHTESKQPPLADRDLLHDQYDDTNLRLLQRYLAIKPPPHPVSLPVPSAEAVGPQASVIQEYEQDTALMDSTSEYSISDYED